MKKSILIRKSQRGFSMVNSLVLMGGVSMVAIGVTGASITANNLANKSGQKLIANSLAESGTQDLYDQIRNAIRTNQTIPQSISSTDMNSTIGGQTVRIGRYQARIISITPTSTNGASSTSSSSSSSTSGNTTTQTSTSTTTTQVNRSWTVVIEGTGTSHGGTTSIIRARFSGSQVEENENSAVTTTTTTTTSAPPSSSSGSTSGSGTTTQVNAVFENDALQSNERIDFVVNQGIRTFDNGGSPRAGNVFANSGATWQMASGNKSTWVNPNVFEIQGQIKVPGNGSSASAYNLTVGANGMGNPNGTVNYRTDSLSNPQVQANTIMNAGNRRVFASESVVDSWRSSWDALAPAGSTNRRTGSLTSGGVPQRPGDQWRILQAPMVIEGDLTINPGDVLRLMPNSDPARNVIYVKGNIRNQALLYNLGVRVVTDGTYTDTASAEYRLHTQGSPFSSMNQVVQHAALVSTLKANNAIQISTNSTTEYGLVYAAKGGIRITGNLEMRDAMVVAGGEGSNGGLVVRPNGGNSFVIHYNRNIAGTRNGWAGTGGTTTTTTAPPSAPTTTTSTNTTNSSSSRIITPFRTGRLTAWQRIR